MPARPAATPRGRPALLIFVIAAGVAGFVIVLTSVTVREPVIADTAGYLTAGERLADGDGLTWSDPANAEVGPWFGPFAYPVPGPGADELTYGKPPGFPTIVGATASVAGAGVTWLVTPLLAIAGVVATGALGWVLTRRRAVALVAGALLLAAPDLWRFGADAWADVPTMTFTAGGLACFVAVGNARGARSATSLAVAAGALLGATVLIRAASLVIVPALLAVEVVANRVEPGLWRRRWPAHAVLVAAAGGLLAYQAAAFGGPLTSGYSAEYGWYPHPAFRLSYAFGDSFADGASVPAIAATLFRNAGPLVLPAALVGWWTVARRHRTVLPVVAAALAAPYAVYAFAPEGINARFLLPVVPLVAVSGAAGLVGAVDRVSRSWRVPLAVGLAAAVAVPASFVVSDEVGDARDRREAAADRVDRAEALVAGVPADAVFAAYIFNDPIALYGERTVLNYRRIPPSDPAQRRYRSELFEPCFTTAVAELLGDGRPVFFVHDTPDPPWDAALVVERRFTTRRLATQPPMTELLEVNGPIDACPLVTGGR